MTKRDEKAASDNTEEKQSGLTPWQPGQSGNPSGRPKGARSKLSEGFLNALQADFEQHGPDVIAKVRAEKCLCRAKSLRGSSEGFAKKFKLRHYRTIVLEMLWIFQSRLRARWIRYRCHPLVTPTEDAKLTGGQF